MFNFRGFIRRVAAVALALVISFAGSGAAAYAKTTGTTDAEKYNSYSYNYKVKDYSTTFTGTQTSIDVECYYETFSMSGSGKAVKRINKFFKNLAKGFNPEDILEYAEMYADDQNAEDGMTYYDTNKAWVVYNDGKYISVTMDRYWYAGGVNNIFHDGYTFALKNGKRASVTKITGLTMDQIKEKIRDYIRDFGTMDELVTSYIDGLTATNINYYLTKDKQCVLTFAPYTIGNGGQACELVIDLK